MQGKQEKMYRAIAQHGENLNAIFHTGLDSITLCKKLRRLELQAEKIAVDYCNGTIDGEVFDGRSQVILSKVDDILHFRRQNIPVFFNGDPRGYALKIRDNWMKEHVIIPFHKDWGGYGIIAPDYKEGGE